MVCRARCDWCIKNIKIDNFVSKNFNAEHSCGRSFDNPLTTIKWLVNKYYDRIRMNPTSSAKYLKAIIQQEYALNVPIHKVYRVKNEVLTIIISTKREEYNLL